MRTRSSAVVSKTKKAEEELITSSSRKRTRLEQQSLLSPARKRVSGGKPLPRPPPTNLAPPPPQKEEGNESLLVTIFSPVLQLFKGLTGEPSNIDSSVVAAAAAAAADDDDDEHEEIDVSGTGRTCVEEEETSVEEETIDDCFDPYLFIKHLPELSQVVPACRRLLLPRRTRRCPPITLVLDLDETLVHSTLDQTDDADFSFPVYFNSEQHMVYVRRRPHLQMFMERVAQLFEIIVFTASQSDYAEQLLNILDPKRRVFRHRIFRDSCVCVGGNYLKDLSVLGRDLSKIVIVDNSPQAFGFQVDNGIPIESWFDDRSDCELASLLPFLESLAGVEDVRPIIANTYKLRQKIEAAIQPVSGSLLS